MMLKRFVCASEGERHVIVSLKSFSSLEAAAMQAIGVSVITLDILNSIELLAKAIGFSRDIRRMRPKAIICWMYHANSFGAIAKACAFSNVPVIWTVHHSLNQFKAESRSTKLAIVVNRLLSPLPNGIVFCSMRSLEQHRDFGFSIQHSAFIPNGYEFSDGETFRLLPSEIKKRKKIRVGAAGRFHAVKDYPSMLSAAAKVLKQHENVEFVLAGNGVSMDNSEFKSLVITSGVDTTRLRLLGEVTDMDAFYSSLDLFVLSSVTEAFPNVLAEAMGYSVPCVSTNVGDAAYIINGFGKVVPPHSSEKLADAITELINMPEEDRRALGHRARESVLSRFHIKCIAKRYLDFIYGHDRNAMANNG